MGSPFDILEELQDAVDPSTVKNRIRIFFRNIKFGIVSLFTWFPVIWSDRNWDHTYTYRILQKKLEILQKYFANPKNIHMAEEQRLHILRYVRIAKVLIDRLIEDDFYTPQEQLKLDTIKFEWLDADVPGFVEMKRVSGISSEESAEIFNAANRRRDKTRKLFFSVLDKKLDRWWD